MWGSRSGKERGRSTHARSTATPTSPYTELPQEVKPHKASWSAFGEKVRNRQIVPFEKKLHLGKDDSIPSLRPSPPAPGSGERESL